MASHEKITEANNRDRKNARTVKFLGACIFMCLVFFAGFLVRGNTIIMGALGISTVVSSEDAQKSEAVSTSTYNTVSGRVAEVEGILANDSIDKYDVSTATTKVIDAFLSSVSDPYLSYFNEESYRSYLASASNTDEGIGVLFGEENGKCVVVDVLPDSEAYAAGVQPGDYVDAIDGESRAQWTMPDVIAALSRNSGDSVYLIWRRPAVEQNAKETTFSTTLTYTNVSDVNVTYEMFDGVAYIQIKQLTSDSSTVVSDAIKEASGKGATAFVLDLRNVSGGYLAQAVNIASLFIPSGTIVKIQSNNNITPKSADGSAITTLPLVVITNGHTAGAAEVLVAALQENGRASIVGSTTQGKGSVQVMQPLQFGGALRYTAATYLTPQDRELNGSGVSPDVSVNKEASQKTIAIDLAQSKSAQ